ncbi:hypothetical protein C0991_011090 [Blastosporella zonata]|nr:hypothetical protein C0991_011090 [Blastosporella zonata]
MSASRKYSSTDVRTSILDKPLPAPVPLPDEASPIQGEYAHLWSMIVGDDVTLPDIPEGSTDNPPSKQESSNRANHSNVAGLATSLGSSNHHFNSPSGAQRPSPPIASQATTISDPEVDLRSPPPQSDRYSSCIAGPGSSAASARRATLPFDDDVKPSKHQKSYEHASINQFSVIPEQSFDSAPLSTSPSANRKLSKSTKPAGQPTSIIPSPSTAHRESASRPGFPPSQPVQEEARSLPHPAADIMGAGIHQQRTLYKDPVMMVPNNQCRVVASPPPPPALIPSQQQRMSVQYTPTPATTSPPRKTSSMRLPPGKVPGKPLIFTTMAAIDQRGPPTAPVNAPVQYKNFPEPGVPPQQSQYQQQQQQHASHPSAVLPPPRKDSLRPYPDPPQPQIPPQPQPQLRGQSPATFGHGSQAGLSLIPPSSSASQNIASPTANPTKGPFHAPHPNGNPPLPVHHETPTPAIRQSPSRSRRPSNKSQHSIDHSHTSVVGTSSEPFQRTPIKGRPTTPISPGKAGPIQIDGDVLGVPLDDDPFAKVEGVKMILPTVSRPPSPTGTVATGKRGKYGKEELSDSGSFEPSRPGSSANLPPSPSPMSSDEELRRSSEKEEEVVVINKDTLMVDPPIIYAGRYGRDCLTSFLGDAKLLAMLLGFFSFYDWCMILSLSRDIRFMIVQDPMLRETVLERFLKTVGYTRWAWNELDPLSLSLQDLNDYMRGVSTPTHEYARIAALYNHSLYVHPSHRDQSLYDTVRQLAASTRAYTRVVLRLRAQGEKEVAIARARGPMRGGSRPPSRASSPTFSHSNHSHASVHNSQPQPARPSAVTFQSPLFRLKRAPLLRAFVPSPDGDWLSDKSVLECEAECRRAGVMGLLRLGDVVWDVAVGDEGNVGRLVWDGSYLIDLDYTYSPIGDLPKYMPTFAFPPSYFHRVIRTGPNSSNPIVHIDVRPWGEEVAANLQLLQDRVRTETPQGAYHNVVRWVHRSSFVIRPPGRSAARSSNQHSPTVPARVPIPETNLFVDPGWYGTIVVETEGTNESLADLQDRCGPGAFPPRPAPVNGFKATDRENKLVYRILREKSRPGEIWIRAVSPKERVL